MVIVRYYLYIAQHSKGDVSQVLKPQSEHSPVSVLAFAYDRFLVLQHEGVCESQNADRAR